MAIRCHCARCKTEFLAPDGFAGTRIACPVCRRGVYAPGDSGQAAPSTPAKTPSLLDAIEEELGPGSALPGPSSASGQDWGRHQDPYGGPRRSRSALRLSRRAAIAVAAAGALGLYTLILLAVPKLGLFLGWLIFGAGLLLVFTGTCWQLYVALRESTSCMVWSIVFPFYGLYFLITRWDKTRKAFATVLGGILVCGGAVGATVYANHLIEQRQPAPSAGRPARPRSKPSKPRAAPRPAPPSPGTKTGTAASGASPGQAPSKPTMSEKGVPGKAAEEDYDIPPATDLVTPPPAGWDKK